MNRNLRWAIAVSAITLWAIAALLSRPQAQGQLAARHPVAALNLPAELPIPTGYTVENAFPGITFTQPLCIASPPGETDRLFVIEKTGKVNVITNLSQNPTKQVFFDVPAMLAATRQGVLGQDVEWGVLGIAFHPNYAQNGYFYLTYDFTIMENGRRVGFDRLSRFTVSKTDPNKADPASELPMITQLDLAPNHNGGDIHFGPDGYLYYGMGDEGNANDSFNNARFIDKDFFAAIYRLDVDKKPGSLPPNPHSQNSQKYPSAVNPGSYAIPPDNPFINAKTHDDRVLDPKKIRTELYICGLRNPWRFSFDPPTGRLFIGDVGQDLYEEIDIGKAGADFGWSFFEGFHNGPRLPSKPADVQTVPPIYEYAHKPANNPLNGNCIIGGYVYRGNKLTELLGQYIFADYGSHRIWSLKEIPDKQTGPAQPGAQPSSKWVPTLLADTGRAFTAFGVDPRDGELLLTDFQRGTIMRLIRAGTRGVNPPALLSQTGAFSDITSLQPSDSLVPYTPNVAFWSDYAIKSRWFYLPQTAGKISFAVDGSWTFPTGMVWVKHFDIETRRGDPTSRKRLETRFLVKTADGVYGISYKWRDDQSDADLVPETGFDQTFPVQVDGQTQTQKWHYPSRSECLTCHTSIAGEALGFNTRQLNGPQKYGRQTVNQLQALSDAGYFSNPVPDPKTLPAFVKADDQTQPLELRVRSYLAANCVQCHQPGGVAQGRFDARPEIAMDATNLVNGLLVNNGGDPDNRWEVPGDTAHSMVLKRLKGIGGNRMPPLASNEIDPNAIKLLTQWIEESARKATGN
jgi:uncharacterized repeat protein (TIGR03806 family)